MRTAVFDLGGTLMEYIGMPENWTAFYEQGMQTVNSHFCCGATTTDIAGSVDILRSWNLRITAREKEVQPDWLFEKAVSHWENRPPVPGCIQVFFQSLHLTSKIFPDTIPCLSKLREVGIHIAALTDLPSGMPDELFQRDVQELLPYLDLYVSSAVCGYRKPNPRGLEVIAEHFHIPVRELVLFGDEEKDKLAAENAGCRFVAVRRREQEPFDLWELVREHIILAHTMEYSGPALPAPNLCLRNYSDADYPAYRDAYNDCFSDMRRALHLSPIHCCSDRAALLSKAENIFLLETDGELAGSVAIYGNEIDDLFVRKDCQKKGYGHGLLQFAVACMQQRGTQPIILHVADWNQSAVRLYERNGFRITATEVV